MNNNMLVQIDDFSVEVQWKPVLRLHLRVLPPDGRIRLSLPLNVTLEKGIALVRQHADWIARTRKRMLSEAEQARFQYVTGERHIFFGTPYTLQVEHITLGNSVSVTGNTILLKCSAGSTEIGRKAIYNNFLRKQLASVLDKYMSHWLQRTGEGAVTWSIRRMKTEWGSCTPARRTMRFNLDLVRYPMPYIEYVVVHEITHLRIANHSAAFWALMSERLPDWKLRRKQLNSRQPMIDVL